MRMLVESLKRLYETRKITKTYLENLKKSKKLTKEEYEYITIGTK